MLAVLTLGGLVSVFRQSRLWAFWLAACIAIVNFFWMRNVLQRILGLLPAKRNAVRSDALSLPA